MPTWACKRNSDQSQSDMIAQIDREYMNYGVARSVRRLVSYGLFEGRAVTTKGRFINPLVFAWLKVLACLPGEPKVRQPVFITGLGRSGTTILGILLSLHRQAGYLNEPKAMWHIIDPRQDINGNYSSAGARYHMNASDVTPEISRRAHRLYARYLATISAERVVDKYPELIFRVGFVRSIFPDAKFIFMTRNGVNAISSIVKWSEQESGKQGNHSDDWWGKDDIKWHYICEQLIQPDKAFEEIWKMPLAKLDHVNRAALEWVLTMREGMAQQRRAICFIAVKRALAGY